MGTDMQHYKRGEVLESSNWVLKKGKGGKKETYRDGKVRFQDGHIRISDQWI